MADPAQILKKAVPLLPNKLKEDVPIDLKEDVPIDTFRRNAGVGFDYEFQGCTRQIYRVV
jgi:hypothetical protein